MKSNLTDKILYINALKLYCLHFLNLLILFFCPVYLTSLYFLLLLSAALSDRGTVVLEAAMSGALSALERASSDRSHAEAGCRGCVPCLFQDCGQLTGPCCM